MSESKIVTNISNNEIVTPQKPKKFRVHAIDNLRGLMIIYIVLIHAMGAFIARPDNWIYGVTWAIADAIAAPAFTFVSGISLSLSYFAELEKIEKAPNYTAWHARIKFLVRTLWLGYIALAVAIMNTILTGSSKFFLWEIMQTLFFARLFGYLFLKYSPKIKLAVGLIFFIFSEPLHALLSGTGIIYDLFFSQLEWNTPFPFFGFFFIGMAIGDWVYGSIKNISRGEKPLKITEPKTLFIIGMCSTGIAILFGLFLRNGYVVDILIFQITRFQPTWFISGFFSFLVKNSIQWCFYCIGIQFMVLALFMWKDYSRLKKPTCNTKATEGNPSKFLGVFGTWSLTIYLLQHVAFILFTEWFSFLVFIPVFIVYLLTYYFLMKLWNHPKFLNGKYTFEWMIQWNADWTIKKLEPFIKKRTEGKPAK